MFQMHIGKYPNTSGYHVCKHSLKRNKKNSSVICLQSLLQLLFKKSFGSLTGVKNDS